jgi:hypothetical protein
MTASVKTGQVDGIKAIGLASITGLARDQRRSDHLAVEAIFGENTMKNKTSARCFVAGSHGTLGAELPKETPHLHEISREFDNLGLVALAVKDGGGNRFGMDI